MISSSARAAGDEGYARLARSLSVSLRAAGLQLRNASDEYNKQLEAALARGQQVEIRYSNLPMDDLHLAFHALLSEMASARDYLARVAGRRVNAPDNIDALARLRQWTERPINSAALNDTLVQRLLETSEATASDPWLSSFFCQCEKVSELATAAGGIDGGQADKGARKGPGDVSRAGAEDLDTLQNRGRGERRAGDAEDRRAADGGGSRRNPIGSYAFSISH
jgi:hypothetical protein